MCLGYLIKAGLAAFLVLSINDGAQDKQGHGIDIVDMVRFV